MLSEGKIEHDGIEIIAHDSPITTYEVKGYDGEVFCSPKTGPKVRRYFQDVKIRSKGVLAS